MVFVVGTFVLVLGIVYGLYWLFVEREEAEEQQALRKRLKRPSREERDHGGPAEREGSPERRGRVRTVLGSMGRVTDPMQRTIAQSGLKVTVSTVLLASACVGGPGLHRRDAVPAHAAGRPGGGDLRCVPARTSFVKMARNRRMIKFEEQFPEAIDLLARALRAGHALTTGLSMVGDEMAEPVGPEFRLLFDQQNFGMPLPQALKAFARSHADSRRAVLRDRGADAARGGRQPFGSARQPGVDHPRSLPGQAAGAGHLGARPNHRLDSVGAAGRAWRCSSRSRARRRTGSSTPTRSGSR